MPLGRGRVGVNFVGTYVQSFKVSVLSGLPALDYAGTTANGSASPVAVPRFKSVTSLSFAGQPVSASLRWRHIGALKDVSLITNPASTVPGVPRINYFDANISATVQNQFNIGFGITNITNKAPPVIGGTLGNFDYSTYDVIGRTFFLSASARF